MYIHHDTNNFFTFWSFFVREVWRVSPCQRAFGWCCIHHWGWKRKKKKVRLLCWKGEKAKGGWIRREEGRIRRHAINDEGGEKVTNENPREMCTYTTGISFNHKTAPKEIKFFSFYLLYHRRRFLFPCVRYYFKKKETFTLCCTFTTAASRNLIWISFLFLEGKVKSI